MKPDERLQKKLQPASKFEESKVSALVKAASNGITINSLRNADALRCSAVLQLEIEDCAAAYCAAPNTEGETIVEAVRFALSQFGHLNIGEVREAFRLAAAGKIEVDLNAYHGLFSVRILGSVLSAYADYRTQIAREIRSRENAAHLDTENAQRADAMKEHFGTLADNLAELQEVNTRYARWQDLPYWFCRRLIEESTLKVTIEEKSRVWIEAKHWAVNQLGYWLLDAEVQPETRLRYKAAKSVVNADPDAFPDELQPEAKEAYAKKLVFNHIAQFSGQAK